MRALVKVRAAVEFLRRADISNSQNEAEEIIAHCLGMNRMNLFRDNPEIGEKVMQHIETYLQRRAQREPLQYVLGYTEFHGLVILQFTVPIHQKPQFTMPKKMQGPTAFKTSHF